VAGVSLNFLKSLRMAVAVFLCLAVLALPAAIAAQSPRITVAAAADLNSVLPEIAAAFERTAGIGVQPVFGSSGNFYAQIRNGAPFDVFLSANLDYPERLAREGFAFPDSLLRYARGTLVLWVPNRLALDPAQGLRLLLRPEVHKVAMANPAHAPYGQAAEAALRSSGLYDAVKPKLILGENISQTAQFVQSGNAEAGLLALSLAGGQAMQSQGKYWTVPDSLYPALDQGAVLLKSAAQQTAGRKFLEFLAGPQAREILARHGFRRPSGESGP
jgi:molybdate transport system substrate-binding protein